MVVHASIMFEKLLSEFEIQNCNLTLQPFIHYNNAYAIAIDYFPCYIFGHRKLSTAKYGRRLTLFSS